MVAIQEILLILACVVFLLATVLGWGKGLPLSLIALGLFLVTLASTLAAFGV